MTMATTIGWSRRGTASRWGSGGNYNYGQVMVVVVQLLSISCWGLVVGVVLLGAAAGCWLLSLTTMSFCGVLCVSLAVVGLFVFGV